VPEIGKKKNVPCCLSTVKTICDFSAVEIIWYYENILKEEGLVK
jgi:hypothetical protein